MNDAKTIAAELPSLPFIANAIKSMEPGEFYSCPDEDVWTWYMAAAELFEGHCYMYRLSKLGEEAREIYMEDSK